MPGPLPTESRYVFIQDSVITENGLGASVKSSSSDDVYIDITGLRPGNDVVISYYVNSDGSGPRPTFHTPTNMTYVKGISTISSTEKAVSGMRIYTPTKSYTRINLEDAALDTSYLVMAYQA